MFILSLFVGKKGERGGCTDMEYGMTGDWFIIDQNLWFYNYIEIYSFIHLSDSFHV